MLIDEKNFIDLVIQFTKYAHSKFTKIMRKIEEHDAKKYLMVDDYMLDKVIHKIKEKNTHSTI